MNPEERAASAPGHDNCIMCGRENPFSFGLEFRRDMKGEVSAEFQARPELQGYEGILHGGVISALLDSAMVHCLFQADIEAVTADLRVRFRHPVAHDARLLLRSRILESFPPLHKLSAELVHEGKVMARAEAKFMEKKAR